MKETIKHEIEPILYKICLLEANAIINKINETFEQINLPPLTSIPRTRDWIFLSDTSVLMGKELMALIKNHVTSIHDRQKLVGWISNYKAKVRHAWINDFIQNTSLPIHQDFDSHIRCFSRNMMDRERNVKEWFHFSLHERNRDISSLMRFIFPWHQTEQGDVIWSMINTCYLVGVPVNITNDIYVKLCKAQSLKRENNQ